VEVEEEEVVEAVRWVTSMRSVKLGWAWVSGSAVQLEGH